MAGYVCVSTSTGGTGLIALRVSRVGNGQRATSIKRVGGGLVFRRMFDGGTNARSTFRALSSAGSYRWACTRLSSVLLGGSAPIRGHRITKPGSRAILPFARRHADFCLDFTALLFSSLLLFFPQSAEAPDHSTTGPVLGSMKCAQLVGHVLMSMASSQRKLILR